MPECRYAGHGVSALQTNMMWRGPLSRKSYDPRGLSLVQPCRVGCLVDISCAASTYEEVFKRCHNHPWCPAERWNENFCRTGILAGEILGAGFCDNESMGGRRGGSAVSLQLACSMYCEDAEFRRLLPHFKIMILSIKHETLGSTLWLLFGKWLSFGY